MIAATACLLLAAAVWTAAPRLLTRGRWRVRHPRVALASWHAAMLTGAIAALASLVSSVWTALGVSSATEETNAIVASLLGWAALGTAGAALAVAFAGGDQLAGASTRSYAEVLTLPHRRESLDRRTALLTCEADDLFACAIPGRNPAVAVSHGLRRTLTTAQLRAVVAHERAHLRGHHYIALRVAEFHCTCLPKSRTGRQLLRATRLLVELIADDEAARRTGAVHLANALSIVARETGDVAMEVRAERLAGRSWTPSRRLVSTAEPVFRT